MIDRIDGIGVAVSLALLAIVLELSRRRKLTEEYSLLWVLCGVGLLVLSIRRDWLDRSALWLGVYYPPSLLLLALIVVVFVAALSFSVVLSSHRRQIERLIEDTALLAAELREVRESPDMMAEPRSSDGAEAGSAVGAISPTPMVTDAPRYGAEPRGQ